MVHQFLPGGEILNKILWPVLPLHSITNPNGSLSKTCTSCLVIWYLWGALSENLRELRNCSLYCSDSPQTPLPFVIASQFLTIR